MRQDLLGKEKAGYSQTLIHSSFSGNMLKMNKYLYLTRLYWYNMYKMNETA
ncbi:hypothetical protein BVN1_23340 [Bacillus velezensis]|nr:hypothetical protein B425_2235 [Bacillus amyloliquefaciens]GJJ26570.1 hypothetical protein BVN1_23340 [Bacillus velezensis]